MKILISGSSGMVGHALQLFLKEQGHATFRLVRNQNEARYDTIFWNPEKEEVNRDALEGFDAIVNLCGENISKERWSEERKRLILNSRIASTHFLSKTLAQLKYPPNVFITTSAIGFYGDQGDQICTEKTSAGSNFLANVCQHWESAADSAKERGIRTAIIRLGIVLSTKGGALAKMLPAFKWGLGGTLGLGEQYMSWISIDDVVSIILFVMNHTHLEGPINVVAPSPETNKEFTKTLGEVLNRFTFLSVPAFALKILLGKEMAEGLLLNSTRALPVKLLESGYVFHYPNLKKSLIFLLKK